MNFNELKDIEFVTEKLPDMVNRAQKCLENNLGRKLAKADPVFILLSTLFSLIYQLIELINDLARQNLLAYARGDNLEHIGILVGTQRLQPASAKTTVEVKLSAAQSNPVTIKKDTRVHAGDNIYFAIDSDLIFLAGETDTTVTATCLQTGEIGNGYDAGKLNIIVDPQPFLLSITNTTESAGGADLESDDDYRERIRQAPESFSCAGSYGSYEYFTRSFSTLIKDVQIFSESAGEVDIYPLLADGDLPNEEFRNNLQDFLSADKIRPITDYVQVKSPAIVYYDINLRYLISKSDALIEQDIISAVEDAVNEFTIWQKSFIGRDINQTELYYKVRSAGAKRCEIISPAFTVINNKSVAVCRNITLNYGGLEYD